MAKIMAKSCKESRSWLVRLSAQGQEGGSPITLGMLLLRGIPDIPLGASPSCQALVPFMQCSHEKKRALDVGSNPAPLFASSKLGPNTSPLWA